MRTLSRQFNLLVHHDEPPSFYKPRTNTEDTAPASIKYAAWFDREQHASPI
jgi:hypothetical protein